MNAVKGLALIGGGGLNPELEEVIRELLRYTKRDRPRVIVVITVGPNETEPDKLILTVKDGLGQRFQGLGADSAFVILRDRDGAENHQNIALIRESDFIYIFGGATNVKLEFMRDTGLWREIVSALQNGTIVAGTSGGAMILAEACLIYDPVNPTTLPETWSQGFNLVPGIGIAPHFNEFPPQWAEKIIASRPTNISIVGIDLFTGMICLGDHWRVVGKGNVTLVTAPDRTLYANGDHIQLP
jgi:cyanophycinase